MLNSNASLLLLELLEGFVEMGCIWRLSTHVDDGEDDTMVLTFRSDKSSARLFFRASGAFLT